MSVHMSFYRAKDVKASLERGDDYELLRITGFTEAWTDNAWSRFEIAIFLKDGDAFGQISDVVVDDRKRRNGQQSEQQNKERS